jgi:hypothetical protein
VASISTLIPEIMLLIISPLLTYVCASVSWFRACEPIAGKLQGDGFGGMCVAACYETALLLLLFLL